MANFERGWCPRCGTYTNFYNVETGVWECDDCGYEKDDYDSEEGEIEGYDGFDDEEDFDEEDDYDDEEGEIEDYDDFDDEEDFDDEDGEF